MKKIIKMSESLSNMIAAGEVVDRPASVVKELIENSLDAKATQIVVAIRAFGLEEIKIVDNGLGMSEKNIRLAFERHATSKLINENDLLRISTLGFRGEAIPTISSVSRTSITSRTQTTEGYEVVYQAGRKIKEAKVSANVGTTVVVSDLFYNTPARLKYIKSEYTEKAIITTIFEKLAMSNPQVSMALFFDDVLVKKTVGNNDSFNLLAAIYGNNHLKNLVIFEEEFQKINITGILVSPEITKSRKTDISIFVNGRYIRNYRLTEAVIEGYRGFLMTNRYPVAMIYLEIEPSLLDVNVHPQKYEIKFANEYIIGFHITEYIKIALRNNQLYIPEVFLSKQVEPQKITSLFDILPLKEEYDGFLNETKKEQASLNWLENNNQLSRESINISKSKIPYFEYVGHFLGTYLIFQNENGMFLIDQHAAAEKIRYEEVIANLRRESFMRKDLLIAYETKLNHQELEIVNSSTKQFDQFGFEFLDSKVSSIPSWLKDDEIDTMLETMVHAIHSNLTLSNEVLLNEIAKEISCKGSLKANKHLSQFEINKLVSDLRNLVNPYTCPHGRPIIIELTKYEIEKMFKRVV